MSGYIEDYRHQNLQCNDMRYQQMACFVVITTEENQKTKHLEEK